MSEPLSQDHLDLKVKNRPIEELRLPSRRARKHSKKQVQQLAASIRAFGFVNPVLLGVQDEVIAGAARVEAARSLDMTHLPTIRLDHMSEADRRAYRIADNRLAELAGWDRELLSLELQELEVLDLDFELETLGFEGAELDQLLDGDAVEIEDDVPAIGAAPVSRLGDVWKMGEHRLVCGDARDPGAYTALLGDERARMMFTDPPYNVPIAGFVGGGGVNRPREFVMASGEMTPEAFTTFLTDSLGVAARHLVDGAISFVCMDWRHMEELLAAGRITFTQLKNLIVWAKENAGMGQFYRSQHELIFVFKTGTAPHVNTFKLGGSGRYRSNVWTYPGVSGFGVGRDEALEMHPTVKPVSMIADAIRDVSRRGDIVLDSFGGSGSTLIAAEKTHRRARVVELDPLYCDVICRRWRRFSGRDAVRISDGVAFPAAEEAARPELAEIVDG